MNNRIQFRVSDKNNMINTYNNINEIGFKNQLEINNKYCLDLFINDEIMGWIDFYVDENEYAFIKKIHFDKDDKLLRPFYLNFIKSCGFKILKKATYNRLNYIYNELNETWSDDEYL